MKLPFDENLSPRLVDALIDLWPHSTHIEALGLRGSADDAIWRETRAKGFTIVSKDDDFRSFALVRGAPPKVIWLQAGNASTKRVAELLLRNAAELTAFDQDPTEAFLTLRG